jgi:uncharacterized protein YkwD
MNQWQAYKDIIHVIWSKQLKKVTQNRQHNMSSQANTDQDNKIICFNINNHKRK